MKTLTKLSILILLSVLLRTNLQSQGAISLVVSITGNVLDEVTKAPVSTGLEVVDENGTRIARVKTNSSDGYYFITGLHPGKTYFIKNVVDITNSKRYFLQKFEIKIPQTDSYQEYSKDFVLKPLSIGMKIPVRVSPFSRNKAIVRSGGEIILKRLVQDFKQNPRVQIDFVCYPDGTENENENLKLTEERANALKSFFVANGIPAENIGIQGNKQIDPVVPPPHYRSPKGKEYKGTIYMEIKGY